MKKRPLYLVLLIALMVAGVSTGHASYTEHPLTRDLIDRMVNKYDFERDELEQVFARAERKQSIIDAISRPAEKVKPWKDYRKIFLGEKRIDLGVAFWRRYRDDLNRAEKTFGVDPAVVVAVIGVETYYGRNKGGFRVIDALSTLAFDYPPRSPFFTRELENFLLLAREQSRDPLALTGSYAGAMGYGQFMPSSYRHYAVDFDDDGAVDIWDNPVDAIGSVANYLLRHRWRAGEPVAAPARLERSKSTLTFNELQWPESTLAQLGEQGLLPETKQNPQRVAIPLRLEGKDGDEYWLGFPNFYVITRYNHSHLYAMAVYQLSERIRERLGHEAN
jgi:membrane-bound lytic murein transglycosylase B